MTLEDALRFDAVDGAVEYRVQVWDGLRLLFEETREQPVLAVTPSMRRSLRGATSAEMRVWALGPDGRTLAEPQVRSLGGG